MAKDTGPRCVLTMPLLTEPFQEHIIEKRFRIVEQMKNALIRLELGKLKNLQRTKVFRQVQEDIKKRIEELNKKKNNNKDEKDQKDPELSRLYKVRSKLIQDAGLSEYQFKTDIAPFQKHFSCHIYSQVAHPTASDVWRSFEKVLFGDGEIIHFQKRDTLSSVANTNMGEGMDYKDGIFIWKGGDDKTLTKEQKEAFRLKIKVSPPENDYERKMLEKKIKHLRIVRKWVKRRYKYYLQFTLEGEPVKKDRVLGKGRVGLDIGPRTLAVSSATSVMLLELAERIEKNHHKKVLLQRKMDRSRRISNPDNYNPDGTHKKGKKDKIFSKHYNLLRSKVRQLERKNADIRKYEHTRLANDLLPLGNEFYVEEMSFKGLQKRAKETKKDQKGRYLKKKRFGKSLGEKAPAMFLSILEQKLKQYYGKPLVKVNTVTFRASQYDHTDNDYHQKKLYERFTCLSNNDNLQRDLYSAFLLMNADTVHTAVSKSKAKTKAKSKQKPLPTPQHTDRSLCKKAYPAFKAMHDEEIERIKATKKKRPSSFGF